MEIITGVERGRRWRLEEKLRIVAEVAQPGASLADVARRHEVSRGLLWNWRARVQRGELRPERMPMFLPVQITADVPATKPVPAASKAPRLPRQLRLRSPCRIGPAFRLALMSAWRNCAGSWQRCGDAQPAPPQR